MADDERFMTIALDEARAAVQHGDVPIGAVILVDGQIVARTHNRREIDHDPIAHAEILALSEAGRALGRWRLEDATMYVTLEPCAMCAAALVYARLERLVFAAPDPKAGAVVNLFELCDDERLNHRVPWTAGVLRADAESLLRAFFADRR